MKITIISISLFLTTFSMTSQANQRGDFLEMIKAAETACTTPAKYSDKFADPDNTHAQLYCLSAFSFTCTGEHEKAQLNCATVGRMSDIKKCPVCAKSTIQPSK